MSQAPNAVRLGHAFSAPSSEVPHALHVSWIIIIHEITAFRVWLDVRSNAIQHFVADVLVENQLMRNVLRDTGWRHVLHPTDSNVLHVDINLADVPESI
jgi:hypothetical protein